MFSTNLKKAKRKLIKVLAKKKLLAAPSALISGGHLIKSGFGTYGVEYLQIHHWDNGTNLIIGKYCSIADNVRIFLGGNHDTSRVSTFPFGSGQDLIGNRPGHPKSNGNIQIGSDVWIGSHASIMSGVKIGNGAVIAAFAHVVRDVAPYEIVGGNPAKHIKFRFSEEVIQELNSIKWWDWPVKKVMKNRDLLTKNPNLETLNELKAQNSWGSRE